MAIIGTLPNNIQNGQTVDATPVMADFNFIVNQVNANANPLGTFTAPSGTRMLFQQASPPLGWTTDATAPMTDCTVRINPSSGGNTGGVSGWSAWNAQTLNVNSFSLTGSQLPVHSHTITDPGHTHTVNDPGHLHNSPGTGFLVSSPSGSGVSFASSNTVVVNNTAVATTGITNIAGVTGIGGTNNAGSGASVTPTYTVPNIKFADFVMGVKT
jgi:hypothetical protein